MKIRFVSSNEHKIAEAETILGRVGVTVIPNPTKIEELQTEDVERLVKDKLIKAFTMIGRPLFVEHTGLHLHGLNGLPAGLTQIFWDNLKAENFASLVAKLPSNRVTAKTVLAYCDGKQCHMFSGSIDGHVPAVPVGNRDFQWDCVFVPEGETQTFAEMGPRKNEISMRKKALDSFAKILTEAKR
jgi:XTP/dITP diphosphohydrolase